MGLRLKFVFLLIVYFAGFATAVYCLAPAPQAAEGAAQSKTVLDSLLKSDKVADSFNMGMHKCIAMGKDAVNQAAEILRQKIEEAQLQAETQTR